MADESLKWALDFNLQGDGLRQANAGVSQLLQGLTDGRKGMVEFEAAGARMRVSLDGVGSSTSKTGGALREFGIGAAAAVGMLTSALAAGGVALSKFGDTALKAFGERTSTIRAYTTLLGDAGQAEVEFNKAQSLAAKTDLTAGETVKAQQQLMVAGFRGQKLDSTLLAGMDLASISTGDKNEALKSFARATGQILQKGKLQQEELLQLAEGASLSSGLVKEELRKSLGLKSVAEVDKRQAAGQIDANTAIAAIQRAVLAQLGTKKLGEYATGASGSVQGLISNRDEALQNLLKSFDSEMLPSMGKYKEALRAQGEALSLTTASGQNATVALQDFANTSIGLKAAWTDFTTSFVERFGTMYAKTVADLGASQKPLDSFSAATAHLGDVLGRAAPAVALLKEGLLWIGGGVIEAVATGLEMIGQILGTLGEVLADIAAGDLKEAKRDMERLSYQLMGGERRDKEERQKQINEDAKSFVMDGAEKGFDMVAHSRGAYSGALRPPGAAARAGASGGGRGGGSAGGGDFGLGYGGGGGALEVANYASDLSASLAGSPATSGGGVHVERIEINVHGGAASAGEIADKVHSVLMRELGRFQRTPSPGRS